MFNSPFRVSGLVALTIAELLGNGYESGRPNAPEFVTDVVRRGYKLPFAEYIDAIFFAQCLIHPFVFQDSWFSELLSC